MAFDVTDVWTSSPMEKEMSKSDVYQAIQDAASSGGVDPKELMQLAQIESNFDPKARATGSRYRGLLQLDPMNYPPYTESALEDPNIGAELGAKQYKTYKYESALGTDKGWEFGKSPDQFYEKVIRHNQGRKGSRQILNAYNDGKSIQQTSKAPWNRTKKMLNNMTDDDLKILAKIYSKNKDLNRSRESLIESMIGKGTHPSNLAIRSDPDVVKMYVKRQISKVATSSTEVNRILKETQ